MWYNPSKKLCRNLLVGGALCAASFGMYSCTDTYDLDTKQPSNLNSIYGYMESQGNYSNFMQLIKDLGQDEILSKTGSKTLFVADDDAFKAFFANNKWGVTSYGQLTLAQKKLLLNSAMIDNPYTTSMLSTAVGPVRGEVCRRNNSMTLYDSVLYVSTKSDILPASSRFDEVRANRDSIVMFTDNSSAGPMLHFTAKYLAANKILSSDIDFIYNQPKGTRASDDTYVNNAKVIDANIFCKNGFIHKVDQVIMPLDNMSELIRKSDDSKLYSSILERFAGLDYDKDLTDAYNVNKSKNVDSVFIKRYFSKRSYGTTSGKDNAWTTDKNGIPSDGTLTFDPGWNTYVPAIANNRNGMMEDFAVMLVPSDEALNEWWEHGDGAVIKDYYGSLEATPTSTLSKLINVNMLNSFNASVPSRFNDVLNDANEKLGLTEADIYKVELGCNGVIYRTNKVFTPTSYASVLFPAVVDTTNFKVIEKAVEALDYGAYLNSMVSTYSFFIPTNDGLLSYVDPVSYGATTSNMWQFKYDTSTDKIYAEVYPCKLEGGKWEKTSDTYATRVAWKNNKAVGPYNGQSNASGDKYLADRLEDLLDNITIIEPLVPGKKFYKTKGNTYIRVEGTVDVESEMKVYGSGQYEWQSPLNVSKIYNKQNGKAYVVDGAIMGTRKSVCNILDENPEFSEFLKVVQYSGAVNIQDTKDNWVSVDNKFGNLFNMKKYGDVGAEKKPANANSDYKATYLLNNYHYTIYAPTNEAMQKAYAMGLPTPAMVDEAEAYDAQYEIDHADTKETSDSAAVLREAMLDFVKYHIHDNSVYMDAGFASRDYESAKTELIPATTYNEATGETELTGKYSPGRPYKLKVNVTPNSITVTDNIGNTHNVVPALANFTAREYWVDGKQITNAYSSTLNNSSSVAIHGIDGPLVYDKSQFKYVYKELDSNAKLR